MERTAPPSSSMYRLGRPEQYTDAGLPTRLRNWHAPRTNRWECLSVMSGRLGVQWLDGDGATRWLGADGTRWIAPGLRWRVSGMDADTHFQLETRVDNSSPASAPREVRAALLDEADCVPLNDEAAFTRLLPELSPGRHFLARTPFDLGPPLNGAMASHASRLCGHPLGTRCASHTTLIVYSERVIDLFEYLARDHAVIEAALVGALRGDAERASWLRGALTRHMMIEETLLFPAYLEAGGNPVWVRGLSDDHDLLRQDLDHLADPKSQQRFLLLLDGHDEREEEIVYPDLLARLDRRAEALTRQSMSLGLAAEPDAGVDASGRAAGR